MKDSEHFNILNRAVNFLLIGILLIALGSVSYRIFFQSSLAHIQPESLSPGKAFSIPQGVDVGKSRIILFLALDTNCIYCTESIPFYERVLSRMKGRTVSVIPLFKNDKEDVERYLKEHDFLVEGFISDVNLSDLEIEMTPTLILVDNEQKIIGSYQGLLSSQQEALFMDILEKDFSGE